MFLRICSQVSLFADLHFPVFRCSTTVVEECASVASVSQQCKTGHSSVSALCICRHPLVLFFARFGACRQELGADVEDHFSVGTRFSSSASKQARSLPLAFRPGLWSHSRHSCSALDFSGLTDINQNWKTKVDKLQRSFSHTRWKQALKRTQRQEERHSGGMLSARRTRVLTKWV